MRSPTKRSAVQKRGPRSLGSSKLEPGRHTPGSRRCGESRSTGRPRASRSLSWQQGGTDRRRWHVDFRSALGRGVSRGALRARLESRRARTSGPGVSVGEPLCRSAHRSHEGRTAGDPAQYAVHVAGDGSVPCSSTTTSCDLRRGIRGSVRASRHHQVHRQSRLLGITPSAMVTVRVDNGAIQQNQRRRNVGDRHRRFDRSAERCRDEP